MVEISCEYDGCDVKKEAEVLDAAIRLMEMHERGAHKRKDEKEEEKKCQEKRAQVKLPKFEETEMREEFRRKQNEFTSYSERTKLVGEEIADLYAAMSTPLKRKLLASSKVNKMS